LKSTLFYALHLYQQGFEFLNMGYATALAWVLFVIILAVTLIINRTSGSWVYYAGEGS
jgi:multiple sugar transport system permease protein